MRKISFPTKRLNRGSIARWHLCNGNMQPALNLVADLNLLLDGKQITDEQKVLLKSVREFSGYITAKQQFIQDNGNNFRDEETTTTAFAESSVNDGKQANDKKGADEVGTTVCALLAGSDEGK